MLFATSAVVLPASTGVDQQSPTPGVGTRAATGASIPAALSSTSSISVLPLSTTMQMPMASSAETNTPCAGV